MPIIPKSSKVRFILIILSLVVIFLSFYFKAKEVRAPIVINVQTTDDSANASYLQAQMEDGVIFDDSSVSTSTATSTAATTTKTTKATATTTGTTTRQ